MRHCPASSPVPTRLWRAVAAALALAATAGATWAQQPLAQTNVQALVAALSGNGGGGPTARSFRRTQPPDASSSLCNGQAVAPGATPAGNSGTAGTTTATASRGATGRNLEVVPYAGDTTPGVNLSVQFASASDRLTAADQALLETLAKALKSPELKQDRFAVAGHTDSTGDAGINLELSCARALAVRRFLATKGVAVQRLSAYGFGSNRLLAADQPNAGENRRVEIRKAPE